MTDHRAGWDFPSAPADGDSASGGVRPSDNLLVAYVHLDALCWTFFLYHLQVKAKSLGIRLIDRRARTLREQVAEVDKLLHQGVDVLILRPVATGDADLLAVLRRAQQIGVHLIALDGAVGGGLDISTVAVDNLGGQAGVADYVCRRLGGRGRIAHLQGNQNMEAGQLRTQGLHGVLERYPGVELVHEVELDWGAPRSLREQGAALARATLAAHPALDAIISTSDEAAFGVGEVLRELGLQNKVLLTGFDALPEALIAIEDGVLEASAHQPLEMMAERVLHDAVRLARHDPGSVSHCKLAAQTVTRDNLADATLRALRLFPGVICELDERRREQQASAAFLETLVDNLPLMVLIMEAENLSIVRNNRALDEWLGIARGSLLGKTLSDFMPDERAARFRASDREVLTTGTPLTVADEEAYRPGRGPCFVRTRKVPVFDASGRAAFLLVISEDITERRAAKMALAERTRELEISVETLEKNREKLVAAEKMAALGALVAGVAHELNTPIGNGLIAASTLRDRTRDLCRRFPASLSRAMLENYLDEATQSAEILERNLRRAANLVNSFKQISIDQASSEIRRFSLAKVVAEVVLTLSPTLRKTPFALTQAVPEDIIMDSHAGAIEQVLINLVNNAIIHGLAGRASGRIAISARRRDQDAVMLVVEDDGRGIPGEQIDKVFTPFFTTRGDEGGSGLGLSITHSMVTGLLGGEIELTSTVGVGTRFCLTLPLRVKAA